MTDCVIVGGGIMGMLTARELHDAGMGVTVVERGDAGQEASWAGGGILSPLYPWRYPDAVTRLAAWGQVHYPQLAAALRDESGIDAEWTESGLLILDVQEEAVARDWARRHRLPLELLQGGAAERCEPALGESPGRALWMANVAQIRNPRLAKALRAALLGRGIRILEQTVVDGLLFKAGRLTGVATGAGRIEGDAVVIAAGAWSGALLRSMQMGLEVEPVRGQMLLFQAQPGLLKRIVLAQDRYLIPRRDGRVLMGSTVEHVGFDKSTTAVAEVDLREAAVRLVPALADYPVEQHWAGLRPGSPRGVPFIGEIPGVRGLYVNTGHYRNGVVLGPGSARLLADLLLGRAPIVDPAPYRPRSVA